MSSSTSSSESASPATGRYLKRFGWLAAVLLLGTAAVNLWIDPYYRFGTNWIGVYISAEREFKATAAQQPEFNALILGNSKPSIIDPNAVEQYRFLNAGFAGAKPEEIYWFLERYAKQHELVVLGLDYGMFNATVEPLRENPFTRPFAADLCRYLLNLKSLQYSAEAVARKAIGVEPTILPTGQSNPAPYLKMDAHLEQPHYEPVLDLLRNLTFRDFSYATFRLDYLRAIRDLLAARNIPLIVFINPEHRAVLDLIDSTPAAAAHFDQWRADLRAIFPDLIDFTALPEWSEPGHYYLHDPYHYLPASGTLLIQKLLANPAAES